MGDIKPGGGPVTIRDAAAKEDVFRDSLMDPEDSPPNPGMDPEVRDDDDGGTP
jgi:hypothetical protein